MSNPSRDKSADADVIMAELEELVAKSGEPLLKELISQAKVWKKLGSWSEAGKTALPAGFSFDELLQDTDRGCLLSVSAVLDDLLETRIRRVFVEKGNPSKTDLRELLEEEGSAPLGSFGARILAARALGIIDDTTRTVLRMIKKIRNEEAAHTWINFKFTTDSLKNILVELGSQHAKMVRESATLFKQLTDKENPFVQVSLEKWTFVWIGLLLINRIND